MVGGRYYRGLGPTNSTRGLSVYYYRQDLLAIKDGFLYLIAADNVLSLCLETMQMEKLLRTSSDHRYMVWPVGIPLASVCT